MKQALIGYGGHAREVYNSFSLKEKDNTTFFIDNEYYQGVENTKPLSLFNPEEYMVMIAIADPKIRFDMSKKLPKETKYFTFIHPTAIIMDGVNVGEGSFIGAYSILTTNIKLGKHSILNRICQIGHDCNIGDYFSAMPGAIVSGNVNIGEMVYMGNNSSIREKINIHSMSIIGLNSGVVKDITEPGVYGGVPCKKIR